MEEGGGEEVEPVVGCIGGEIKCGFGLMESFALTAGLVEAP